MISRSQKPYEIHEEYLGSTDEAGKESSDTQSNFLDRLHICCHVIENLS